MSVVKSIGIEVTYRLEYGNLEIPKRVQDQLLKAMRNNESISYTNEKYEESTEWIKNNIDESDAFEWSFIPEIILK